MLIFILNKLSIYSMNKSIQLFLCSMILLCTVSFAQQKNKIYQFDPNASPREHNTE